MYDHRGLVTLLASVLASSLGWVAPAAARAVDPITIRKAVVPFVANTGQWRPEIAYAVPTPAGHAAVDRRGALRYRLAGDDGRRGKLVETFSGGRPVPAPGAPSPTRVSRFVGSDPARWQRALPTWERVRLGEVWPGIAVDVVARGGGVEKLFTVAPGVAPDAIAMTVHGARRLERRADGALVAETAFGPVELSAPVAYQDVDGDRRAIAVAYDVRGRAYGFRVGAWDRSRPLVIDPILRSSFLGGTKDDEAGDLVIHATSGEVIVAGSTDSADFPETIGGAQPSNASPNDDAFLARFSADLSTLLQATYFGGTSAELGTMAVAVDPTSGDVYLAGETFSADLPGRTAASGGAGTGAQTTIAGQPDLFVARFTADLTDLVQSTYVGGADLDEDPVLALHPLSGEVYLAARTSSATFPGTAGGARPLIGGSSDAVVVRLSANLQSVLQSSYYGGTSDDEARALAVHPSSGEVYVYGDTESNDLPSTAGGAISSATNAFGFVARFTSALTALQQASYLPNGSANGMAISALSGDVFVGGGVTSGVPATTGGAQPDPAASSDAYVLRLDAALTTAEQGTYLGGSGSDGVADIVVGASGDVFVVGLTDSEDLPGLAGAAQPTYGGGFSDAFVARLPEALTTFGRVTYFGGESDDTPSALAVLPSTGQVYVTGYTDSPALPATAGSPQSEPAAATDAFVTRISGDLSDTAMPTTTSTTPGASTTSTTLGGTTTTTLPGAECTGLAPLATIACRLGALRSAVATSTGLGRLQPGLIRKLGKAERQMAKAETRCATLPAKKTRKPLKKVGKLVGVVGKKLGSKKAQQNIDPAVSEPLRLAAVDLSATAKTTALAPVCPE